MSENLKNPNESELFPERLKNARKLRDLDQATLAQKAGIPTTSISHFETGNRKPSFDNLRRLAQALTVTTDYLLGRVDSPTVSAQADPLYRHVSNLQAGDRQLAEEFIKFLAGKNKRESDGEN